MLTSVDWKKLHNLYIPIDGIITVSNAISAEPALGGRGSEMAALVLGALLTVVAGLNHPGVWAPQWSHSY